MTYDSRRSRLIFSILAVLCVTMTASNFYLVHKNKSLTAALDKAKLHFGLLNQITTGKTVKVVSGVDFSNQPLVMATSGKRATVLMVYSPTCPYCERNWHNWSSLMNRVDDPQVSFATIDLTSTATKDFLEKKHASRAIPIHKLDPKEFVNLNLNMTPQTILIDGDSKVQAVWTGVLSANDMDELNRLLTS